MPSSWKVAPDSPTTSRWYVRLGKSATREYCAALWTPLAGCHDTSTKSNSSAHASPLPPDRLRGHVWVAATRIGRSRDCLHWPMHALLHHLDRVPVPRGGAGEYVGRVVFVHAPRSGIVASKRRCRRWPLGRRTSTRTHPSAPAAGSSITAQRSCSAASRASSACFASVRARSTASAALSAHRRPPPPPSSAHPSRHAHAADAHDGGLRCAHGQRQLRFVI